MSCDQIGGLLSVDAVSRLDGAVPPRSRRKTPEELLTFGRGSLTTMDAALRNTALAAGVLVCG